MPPAGSFQAIFDKALADYREQISVELDKHPFADELRGRDSPDDVLKLLEDKAKAFKVYRDGNRKLINWLSPVVQVIHTLSGVLGEAVPFKPAKAIFVGVDVLITAADGVSSSYDALVDLFECIGNFLKRLRIYTDIPLSPSMTDIVVKIMVEILSVFALATKQIKQGRFKKFAKKLLGESEIEAVLQRLDRLTQEEGRITVAQTLEVVHGLMNNVKVVMNDGKASTDGMHKALDTMQEMASDINKIRRDLMQKDSKNWLCPPDPSKNYNIGCKTHRDGTATWFFRGSVFDEWNAKGSFLWIHGKPGSGKSILLSSIIRQLDSKRKAGLASMAYYYFDFKDTEKQHLRGLLSSLVFQLSAKSDPCYQILSRLYSDHAGGTQEPSEDTLSQCLVEMLEVPGQPAIYIIIDALDESPNISGMPTAREQVLEFLDYLVQLKLPNLHICVSSRLETDIRKTFEPLAPLRMSLHDESGQKEDISTSINAVVHSDQWPRWGEGDRQLVIDTLSDKADGMFKWVFCQLETLRRTLPVDIRSSLDNLPKTLNETYERALLTINEEIRQHAQRLFLCLAVSIRPLRVEELADVLAVRIDAGVPKFNPNWRLGNAEEAVLSVCSNLISVVDVDGSQVVHFSHFSVKEFLTSTCLATAGEGLSDYHIVPQSAHTILAQASLGVLLQLDNHIDRHTIKNFPLSSYAAQHWVEHGQFEGVSSAIQVAMEHLFNPDKPHFSTWVWIYDIDDPWRGGIPTFHPGQPQATSLYYAVLCGFRQLVEHLIASYPGNVNARGGYYESPLLAALVKEDIDITLSLLQRGADPNVINMSNMSPLYRASASGRIGIVQLLLEYNAEVNLRCFLGRTPLAAASFEGEMEISRLLLQWGADVNCQGKEGLSPLFGAAKSGHLDLVRLLLENGADVGSPLNDGQTPLHPASERGHIKVAELLIQHGADVGSRTNNGLTPLHLASFGGHVNIAELLIQHGADVGSRTNDGQSPLDSASQNGHVKVAELLIQHGADAGSRSNDGRTPLYLASFGGHVNIAELLIQHGADVGSRTNDGRTPLHSASFAGHINIAELLIQHGAHVGSRANDGLTPLYSASHNGHVKVAELLIQHGADVGSPLNDNRSPLYSASRNGHIKVAELLIRHGADVGTRTNKSRTPLHSASFEGHVNIAELLIQHGADVGSRANDGRNPLHLASQGGHIKVAELLIQHGADVGSRADAGRTPLHLAALEGHLDFVKLLLECRADPNIRDDNNRTPLDSSSDNQKLNVANFLSQSAMSLPVDGEVNPTTSTINSQYQRPGIVQPLRPRGGDVEPFSTGNEQPSLFTASREGQIDLVRSLLDQGSDIEERDGFRRTALAVASKFGQVEVAKLLVGIGADVNSRSANGRTPLHQASQSGHLRVVQLLLNHNADPNARTRHPMTSLDLASRFGYLEIAELLIERGANVNVRNGFGRTARQEALAGGHDRIAELLLKHGGGGM